MPPFPRHVVCLIGDWPTLDAVATTVREVGGEDFEIDREFSQLAPDDRMVAAFEASYDRVTPSMKPEDWTAIRQHRAVAYVLSPPIPQSGALEISGKMLRITAALLECGAADAKGESAGIAHGREEWLNLAGDHADALRSGDRHRAAASLVWAWVRRPIHDRTDGMYYSCGMHLLGLPDCEIESSLDTGEAVEWIDLFGLYCAADQPTRPILDGDGFRLKESGARRIVRRHPCRRYAEDEFFFNPYGYVRLEAEGQ